MMNLNPAYRILQSANILILLSLVFIYFSFNTVNIYSKYIGTFDTNTITSCSFLGMYSFLCYFIFPVITAKFFFREKIKDIGLTFPKNVKLAVFLSILALLILLPFMVYFTSLKDFQHYYSLNKMSSLKIIFLQVSLFPVYYFAEEFFFRGFLFLGLWKRVRWHSFWITDVIFTAAHITKPGLEILLCIPANIVLNFLSLYTKSVYPPFIVHCIMGITLSVLVNFYHHY